MSDSIATLALRVKSEEALRDVGNVADATERLGDVAKTAAGALAGLFGVRASWNLGKDLLASAADAQETLGKYEAVLGRYVGDANRVVKELSTSFNFSESQAQASISSMVDIFKKSGLSIRESLDFSEDLNKRAADIEAFTNASGGLDRVANALISAMLGNGEAAKALGVVVLDEFVQEQKAKEAREGLTFATERAALTHARYSLIMRQSATSAGQVARESTNYSNRLRDLRARIDDLKGNFGAALIDPATKIVGALSKAAKSLDSLSPSAKTAVVATGALGVAVAALGVPLAKLVLSWKTCAATQKLATAATEKSTVANVAETVAVETTTAARERSTITTTASAAAIDAETAAINRNTAARAANGAGGAGGGGKRRFIPTKDGSFVETPTRDDGKFGTPDPSLFSGSKNGRDPKSEKEARRAAKIAWRASTSAERYASKGLSLSGLEAEADATRKMKSVSSASNASKILTTKDLVGTALGKAVSKALGALDKLAAPIAKLSGLFSKFSGGIASKLPLLGRFAGTFGAIGGVLGPVVAVGSAVVGALEVFKKAPDWLEIWLDEGWPKVKEFASELPGKIAEGAKTGLVKLGNWGKDLFAGALNGAAETILRLSGEETAASITYALNKKIEAANKAREELLEVEKEQRAAETNALQTATKARKSASQARVERASAGESERARLESARTNVDELGGRISSKSQALDKSEKELASLGAKILETQAKIGEKNVEIAATRVDSSLTDEEKRTRIDALNRESDALRGTFNSLKDARDATAETITNLGSELDDLNARWLEAGQAFDELSANVDDAAKALADAEKDFQKSRDDSAKSLADYATSRAIATATTDAAKSAALQTNIDAKQTAVDEARKAGEEVGTLDAEYRAEQKRLDGAGLAKGTARLKKLAESGATDDAARLEFASALVNLEDAGYGDFDASNFGAGSAARAYEKIVGLQNEDRKKLAETLEKRNEAQEKYATLASAQGELDAATDEKNAFEKEREGRGKERDKAARARSERWSDADSALRKTLEDDAFSRSLEGASTRERLDATRRKVGRDSANAANELAGTYAKIGETTTQIDALTDADKAGTLDEEGRKRLEELTAERDNLESEFLEKRSSALKDRLEGEKTLEGLERDLEKETLETEAAERERAEAAEEAASRERWNAAEQTARELAEPYRKRLEERSQVEEEAKQAVAGQKAISAGSSEAFALTSRVFDRGNQTTEKSVQSIEKNVAEFVRQMTELLANQDDDLSLQMGY